MRIEAKDYFPHKSNSTYIYKSLGNNFLNFKRYTDYQSENKVQMRFDNGITDIINIYEYTDTGVKLSFYQGNYYYRQNFLDIPNNMNNYLIKDPIVKDNTWTLPDGSIRCITNTNINIKTKFNLFNSVIEIITMSNKNHEFSIDYYAKGIGLVKSIYYIDKIGLLSCELQDILDNTPYSKNIKIYYPDKNLNTIWYSNKILDFYTNENTSLKFSKELENPPKGLLPLMNCNTLINELRYDSNKNIAYIDFSRDILSTLNSNLLYSNLFINCIYSTFKDYFNAETIYITLDNIPYNQYFNMIDTNIIGKYQEWKVGDCNYPFTYPVKDDDTLINISRKFNIRYDKIAKLNSIKNPNKISKNQILQIYSSGIYTLKENDSLEAISDMFGLTIENLIEINNISDLSLLTTGQKIKLC